MLYGFLDNSAYRPLRIRFRITYQTDPLRPDSRAHNGTGTSLDPVSWCHYSGRRRSASAESICAHTGCRRLLPEEVLMSGTPERGPWWRELRMELITTALSVLRLLAAAGCFVLWLVRWGVGDPS